MQTPKARTGTLEVPQRTSPGKPRSGRQMKKLGSDSDSAIPVATTPKDRSPKVVDRKSPQSPATEKKRPGRVSELESQLGQLQEELKRAKDQLISSEDAKRQLVAMSAKLEDSQQQLLELSASEESRVQELRKISQDRDRAWQSEVEAVQKQHSTAMNEIQNLKFQLERVAESEASQARNAEQALNEARSLREELNETLRLVEELKESEAFQARNAESAHNEARGLREELDQTLRLVEKLKESEASQAKNAESACNEARSLREELDKTLGLVEQLKSKISVLKESEAWSKIQLEMAERNMESLRAEGLKAVEACRSISPELEKSKARIAILEELVDKLRADHGNGENVSGKNEESTELNHLKMEVSQLRSALELAERRYQEEYIQSTLQIRSAYELVERTKSEWGQKEAEFEANLKAAKAEIEEIRAKSHAISLENEGQNLDFMESNKSEAILLDLRANLLDKETELQSIMAENELLKSEMKEKEEERSKLNNETLASAEAATAAEREALMKVTYLKEEADKSSRKAERAAEQLEAAQSANSEMEAELRRLKVQADQWRKAAEAAATMLSSTGNNNGKYVERTGSLDYHTIGGKLGSPFSEDMDDDSPKKKNGGMFKKIGVLLKGQK